MTQICQIPRTLESWNIQVTTWRQAWRLNKLTSQKKRKAVGHQKKTFIHQFDTDEEESEDEESHEEAVTYEDRGHYHKKHKKHDKDDKYEKEEYQKKGKKKNKKIKKFFKKFFKPNKKKKRRKKVIVQKKKPKVEKKYKKFMMPLLIAYKLKFFTLIPVFIGKLFLYSQLQMLTVVTELVLNFLLMLEKFIGMKEESFPCGDDEEKSLEEGNDYEDDEKEESFFEALLNLDKKSDLEEFEPRI